LIKVKFELHGSFIISFNGFRPWITAWLAGAHGQKIATFILSTFARSSTQRVRTDYRQTGWWVYALNTGNPSSATTKRL
jgi:hypothetical protein